MSPAPQPSVTSVFDAAKAIVGDLEGLDKQSQMQAIRFASESLGLAAPAFGQHALPAPATAIPIHPGAGGLHGTDIKQFTEAKAPKSDQQFTAVVAYYYRFVAPESQRRETVNAEVMTASARGVWPQKRRWSMTLTNAKNAGYLDPAGQGEFKLSAVGENLVAMTLPGSSTQPARRGAGGSGRAANAKGRVARRAKRGR